MPSKTCKKCGADKPAEEFHRRKPRPRQYRDGRDSVCSGCVDAMRRARDQRLYLVAPGRCGALVKSARKRARNIGVPFNLDRSFVDDLWQLSAGRCTVTGMAFVLTPAAGCIRNPLAPSIDRINTSGGYTRGNVRLVLWAVNNAIGDYGLDAFLPIARAMANQNR